MNILRFVALLVVFFVAFTSESFGQVTGRRMPEFSSRQEYVSMDSSMPFDRAIAALSEISKRFIGKIIIDVQERSFPIGVSIRGLHWRDALDLITEANALRIVEKADYMEVRGVREVVQPGDAKKVVTVDTREVYISTVFFSLDIDKSLEYGIDWSVIFSGASSDTGSARLNTFPAGSGAFEGAYGRPYRVGQITGNVSTVLRLFSDNGLGEIISSPRVVVRTGEEGRVQVGEDVAIIESQTTSQGTQFNVRLVPTGSIVTVSPEVIKEGDVQFVSLTLNVERSVVTSITTTPSGTVAPNIARTSTATKLLLVDGEEVFISGLYFTQETTTRTGIPLLKDLPPWFFGLRYIFGSDERSTRRSELAILLKVEVLPTLKERAAKAVKENIIERMREKFQEDVDRMKTKEE
jgi:type II secretory pathway component GspD/PulD (secretin)